MENQLDRKMEHEMGTGDIWRFRITPNSRYLVGNYHVGPIRVSNGG